MRQRISIFRNAVFLGLSALCVGHSFASEGHRVSEGVAAFAEGRLDDAEAYFRAKLDEPQSKNESLIYLSRIYLERGESETALDHAEKALSAEPNNAENFILLGDIYCARAQNASLFSALKMAKKCVAQYALAAEQYPGNVDALVSAINYYFTAPSIAGGSTEKGQVLLERLEKLSPEHASVHKVGFLHQEGSEDAALSLANKLSQKSFESALNQYTIARYYKDNKRYETAKELFESLLEFKPTPRSRWYLNDSLLQLGETYLAEGEDPHKAVALIEEYMKRNNNPHDLHYFWAKWSLAKSYKAIGREDKHEELVRAIKSEDYEKDKFFAKEFEANL